MTPQLRCPICKAKFGPGCDCDYRNMNSQNLISDKINNNYYKPKPLYLKKIC